MHGPAFLAGSGPPSPGSEVFASPHCLLLAELPAALLLGYGLEQALETMQSCGVPSSVRMKWTINLVAEVNPGQSVEHEIATVEREYLLAPVTVGLSIAEGKLILENLQKQMVAAQVQHHNTSLQSCFCCGKAFRTKGYYPWTLRSVYGPVPLGVRRTCRSSLMSRLSLLI